MTERGINILIVGNGFDLAHGLPTKYMDFLHFCRRVQMIWKFGNREQSKIQQNQSFQKTWLDNWDTVESIKDSIMTAFEKREWKLVMSDWHIELEDKILSEIYELVTDNTWYSYFNHICELKSIKGENWIDFESEIRYILQRIDEKSINLNDKISEIFEEIHKENDAKMNLFKKYYDKKNVNNDVNKDSLRAFRQIVYNDLERIIRALELYLGKYVDEIEIDRRIPEIEGAKFDYVINFNYTNTYERIYNNATVFHIHGYCDIARSCEKNNMVLGIDEYWDKDECDSHTNFTIFKKFAQRIQKHTGIENYKYLNEINRFYEKNKERWTGNVDMNTTHPIGVSYVYIFGHSLDITDTDILSGFIGADSTSVIVYCYDRGVEGELIANTIKLIGEEPLLKKVNNVPPKLDYIIQENQ